MSTFETYSSHAQCRFCGKYRHFGTIILHDTERGSEHPGRYKPKVIDVVKDAGCDCALGALEFSKVKVPRMCLNCKHSVDNGSMCNNHEAAKYYAGLFVIASMPLALRDRTKGCKFHSFDDGLLRSIINLDDAE